MTFSDKFKNYSWSQVSEKIYSSSENDVQRILKKNKISEEDIYALLSPAAEKFIEVIAKKSSEITRKRFGKTVQLYTPLYISNECSNRCLYCGFNVDNKIRRVTLSTEEIKKEAKILYDQGFRHILLLTGESPKAVSVKTFSQIAKEIQNQFASISIEVYPMSEEEYKILYKSGIDGLTVYQETYNQEEYKIVHQSGKKRDFFWRLDAPDRGGKAGFRKLGVGALLGLDDWRVDGFFTAIHALHLTKSYWKSHIQVSFPRLKKAKGSFSPKQEVLDSNLVQLLCAIRILLPDATLTISTRESAKFRDNLLPLGVTMMSAGSSTEPGGYSNMGVADNQFDISDTRSSKEISKMLVSKGYEPVWKDWDKIFLDKN